jgi:RNA polymerase sigma-70 factor (ECF subfamily)
LSVLSHESDAEDAVQEVFCKYITKKPDLGDEEHAKAWLIHVATNQCRDILRRRKTRAFVGIDEVSESQSPELSVFENFGIDEENAVALRQLFSLPEKYKTILILHYLEDQSVGSIAESLKISESAVKMRLMRGRDMLRGKLEGI